jgi:hypothetical protein
MRPNRCDCCGGKFGLVSRSLWSRRFCSKPCQQAYQVQTRSIRWVDFLPGHVARGLDRLKSMIQNRSWAGAFSAPLGLDPSVDAGSAQKMRQTQGI